MCNISYTMVYLVLFLTKQKIHTMLSPNNCVAVPWLDRKASKFLILWLIELPIILCITPVVIIIIYPLTVILYATFCSNKRSNISLPEGD